MHKTREILRLKRENGQPVHTTDRLESQPPPAIKVSDHLARAELAGLSWPLPEDMTDSAALSQQAEPHHRRLLFILIKIWIEDRLKMRTRYYFPIRLNLLRLTFIVCV